MEKLYRKTWAEIDLEAIQYNIKEIKKQIPEETKIFAVVKANGYGHGAIPVAKSALEAGANYLAVALLEEALELRKAGIDAPILVFGYVPPEVAPIAAKYRITLTVFQLEWLESVNADKLPHKLNFHLKLDTGMGRLGLQTKEEISQFIKVLQKKQRIHLTGVYTHFATADDLALSLFIKQKKKFKKLLNHLQGLYFKDLCIHWSNSAAAIREPDQTFNAIRFGIAMYGLYPSTAVHKLKTISLKEAFSLHSELVHVKRIKKGSTISYGATYVAKEDEWIGTIPLGYADGWRRDLQGANVLIDGKRCEIVGRICMDQLMVKLDKKYKIGTKVTLIGVQKDKKITVDEVANYLGTINYEIPCMLTNRIPRFVKGN